MLRKGKASSKKKDLQTHCIAAMLLSWSISALVGTFSRLPLPLTGLLSLGGILCFGQLMTVTCKWQEMFNGQKRGILYGGKKRA